MIYQNRLGSASNDPFVRAFLWLLRFKSLREKCRYMEFFFPISPYSVEIKENTDQKNSEYRHFSRSVYFGLSFCSLLTTSLSCTILKVIQRKYCLLYKALLLVFENIFRQYFRQIRHGSEKCRVMEWVVTSPLYSSWLQALH